MKEENQIIIKCLNKYGKVPETYKLLEKIDLLEEENQRLKEEYIMLQNASDEYEDKLLKENKRLNNILKLKTNFIAELLKIILVARDYELQDKCEIRAKIYEEKLQELKESDK